ncbi:MAG: hypothetical protein ACE366_18920 [Bradymonadia bacterium]
MQFPVIPAAAQVQDDAIRTKNPADLFLSTAMMDLYPCLPLAQRMALRARALLSPRDSFVSRM